MSQRQNQAPYNVGFLDDLHRYFPDLLYNSEQFNSVQDVLNYIQTNTRNQFNLYSRGLREYQRERSQQSRSQRAPSPAPAPTPAPAPAVTTPPARPARRTRRRSEEEEHLQEQIPPSMETTAAAALLFEEDTGLNQQMIDILEQIARPRRAFPLNVFSNLFSHRTNLRTNDILPNAFMEPVLVRPTQQQIQAASRVDVLAVASTENCAICQDSFAAHSNRRTLITCGHAFHMNCIDTWFEQNVHCPVCRHDIRDLSVD